jgi:glycosyltransferase involved in cell wall biosynthesis
MFWGTPCIGGEADGTEDDLVIEGVTGKRFVPNSAASLADALQFCAALPTERRTEWARECSRIVRERSNVEQMATVFRRTIHELIPVAPDRIGPTKTHRSED